MDGAPNETQGDEPTRAREWPAHWMGPFLAALASDGIPTQAAERVKISRGHVYRIRASNEEFRVAWDEAVDVALDRAESELYSRAVVGWQEPVFQGGENVGSILKKSDRCLELLLTARRRSTYGGLKDRQHESRGDAPARKVTFVRMEPKT